MSECFGIMSIPPSASIISWVATSPRDPTTMSPDHWSKLTWDTVSAGGYDLFGPIGYLDWKRDRACKQRVIVTPASKYEFNWSSNFHPNFSRIKESNYIVKIWNSAILKKWFIRSYSAILTQKNYFSNSDAFFSPLFSPFLSSLLSRSLSLSFLLFFFLSFTQFFAFSLFISLFRFSLLPFSFISNFPPFAVL